MDDKNKIFLRHCTGFDWDDGNIDKNWKKHKVTPSECEQIFFNLPLIIQNDAKHSEKEVRYIHWAKQMSKDYYLLHSLSETILFELFLQEI